MKTDVLKAVWPRGIPLDEYPRAVALLETLATAKHWREQNHEGNRLHLAFPGVHGSPIGAVPLAVPEALMTEGIRSTRDGRLVSAGAKARPSELKPTGVVSPTAFESLMKDVEEAAKKSADQDCVRAEDFIARPETLRIWKATPGKPKSHCSEALVQRVAALLRAEPCTIARLCALTRKTERPIAEAVRRLGAVEAGRVFRADGSSKGTLPKAWKLPDPSGR